MNQLINQLLNLIFPPRCEVCRQSSEAALCQTCFSSIKFMKPQFGIHSSAVYEGVLRSAIHRLKFSKRKRLVEPLGILMLNYLSRSAMKIKEIDQIVPVPLHAKRHRSRGFNQAELLAGVVGRYHEIPVRPALVRVKNTLPQFDLPRDKRAENIKGAFRVPDPNMVNNKRVLLLDDIYTTGATISECVKTLRNAGANRVEVLTLSRAIVD